MTDLMEINLAIVERARAGQWLTAAEIDELATADVLSLGMLADEVRRSRVGDRVTYVRVHAWTPSEPEAPAAKEIRVNHLGPDLDTTAAMIRAAKSAAGDRWLTGFWLDEIVDRVDDGWGSQDAILAAMKTAGLDAVAHAPVDTLTDAADAIAACGRAGLAVSALSVRRPLDANRTPALLTLRQVANAFPAITTIAPLPKEQSTTAPTTGYDDVRMIALARLVVPGVPRVQVDWSHYGPKLAQVALTFGANDLDAVSAVDDERLGRRRLAVEDVRRNIAAAGFTAVERDARA